MNQVKEKLNLLDLVKKGRKPKTIVIFQRKGEEEKSDEVPRLLGENGTKLKLL